MTDWKPMYPCIDCETNYKTRPCQPPDMAITQKSCLEWTEYKAEIKALKQLLEYQMALQGTGAGDNPRYKDYLPKSFIKSMLKELEELNK
jgi:hypothetical protein